MKGLFALMAMNFVNGIEWHILYVEGSFTSVSYYTMAYIPTFVAVTLSHTGNIWQVNNRYQLHI